MKKAPQELEKSVGFDKIILKLPLLLIPFAVFSFKNVTENLRHKMIVVFNYAMFLPAVVSVYNYLINKTLFDDLILQSKPLPVEFGYGLYHIQFSVLLAAAIVLAIIVPLMGFWLLKRFISGFDAAAIAATYGSVSAVTFVTAISFLDLKQIVYGGQMVAIMAVMEAPAIIVGVLLVSMYDKEGDKKTSLGSLIKHSFTNGSVVLILGSLVIGFLASEKHAEGIKPFTTEIFKGFLAVFLLDMGLQSGKNIFALVKKGWYPFAFAIVIPKKRTLIKICLSFSILISAVTFWLCFSSTYLALAFM